ncbi:MAG: translation initiation factor IF-3 [Planctomycetia bacterium]|nr:translation initiation factor IF-3 [Planctomycetia bacterium]
MEDAAIEKSQRVNEQIRVPSVRVIGGDGAQLGVMTAEQAIALARDAGMDLVEVAPTEKPPVCRIMDFGKFKYQQNKRLHKNHTHQAKIKEIRLRPKTDAHDFLVKVNHAREFLEAKNKVVVSVVFKGREAAHMDEGRKVVEKMIKSLEDISKLEGNPSTMGKRITCMLTPK